MTEPSVSRIIGRNEKRTAIGYVESDCKDNKTGEDWVGTFAM